MIEENSPKAKKLIAEVRQTSRELMAVADAETVSGAVAVAAFAVVDHFVVSWSHALLSCPV